MNNKINVIKLMKKIRIADKSQDHDQIVAKEVFYIHHLKQKIKWNNRFHLEKVPKYDAFNDKNCIISFK